MTFVKGSIAAALLCAVAAVGCKSSYQEGVKSSYRKQSVVVDADVASTTEAARKVFEEDKLANVSVTGPTANKGEVSADDADKTKIFASIEKTAKGTELTLQAGKYVGNPEMGANYAAKIKQVAEGKK